MPDWEIDSRFDTPDNAAVLAFLRANNPSAHSDVAEELLRSAEDIAGVDHYCPDREQYAFVVLYRENSSIIGLAYGQSALAYRLPDNMKQEACDRGGWPAEDVGTGWIRFEPWSNSETLDESRRRLAHWCGVAASRGDAP